MRIDTDIPVPAYGGRRQSYPWRQMRIGDSISVPIEMASRAAIAAASDSRRHGVKYMRRTVIEDGVKVLRIWRVA